LGIHDARFYETSSLEDDELMLKAFLAAGGELQPVNGNCTVATQLHML
jgi:hypothetical protein